MKSRLDPMIPTPKEWVDVVFANFDEFLIDHADNERKASAMGMSFIAKYPDRIKIIAPLIDHAMEELEHFKSVYAIMEERGITFPHKIAEDKYAQMLVKLARSGREERFLDRMMVASVIESRGMEKFRLIAEALEEGELKEFYKEIWVSEAKHGDLFVELAMMYFDEDDVLDRLKYFNEQESLIMQKLPIRPAMH
ncbi:MAG TPA: tRNA-(ms[2]io[6]A)-hydroxylase [Bacteroidetes bacterium]|nr:tRNA-(ms[2]io[6]A)-hydroxylase [Bacteroidota bacterium]